MTASSDIQSAIDRLFTGGGPEAPQQFLLARGFVLTPGGHWIPPADHRQLTFNESLCLQWCHQELGHQAEVLWHGLTS